MSGFSSIENAFFRALPKEVQVEYGRKAFERFIHYDPPFEHSGKWVDLDEELQDRWMAVVETVFNKMEVHIQVLPSLLQTFNDARQVALEARLYFENIRPEDHNFNNHQWYEHLRAAKAQMDVAQILANRGELAAGLNQIEGDEPTHPVHLPNVRMNE